MLGWYVLHSKPKKEQWLYNQLHALDIDVYCPRLNTQAATPHSHIVKPYFPGYLFVNVDLELMGISLLQWIPGSLGLVSFGGEPASVPEGLLQRIRRRIDELNSEQNRIVDSLQPGDELSIQSGPFAGYDAIFCTRLHDAERVQVFLKVLQEQGMKIDLPVNQIRVTKQHKTLL